MYLNKLISTCLLIATAGLLAGCKQAPMPGSYSDASVANQEVINAADFAIRAQAKAMLNAKSETTAQLELVKILAADQQVVAGMHYQLTLLVNLNGEERQANAVVWHQAWRQPDPYQLTSWEWNDK